MPDLSDTVVQDPETGQFTFTCPGDPNDPCGAPGVHTFYSAGHATAESAKARGAQHIAQHVHKTEMPSVSEFLISQGLVPVGDPDLAQNDLSVYLPPED